MTSVVVSGGPKAVMVKCNGSSQAGSKITLALSDVNQSSQRRLLGTADTPANTSNNGVWITCVLNDGTYDLSQNGKWNGNDTLIAIDENGGCTAPTAAVVSA